MPSAPRYRPDIDGLRAVAVLLVLFYHLFPDAIPGGFVGVDIFFVISGFLITGIISRQIDSGRFSLADFYARRIRRIFPALIVVLAACLCAGWLTLLPKAFTQLGRDVAASAAFSANIALLMQSGYFDAEALRKPLLHLWSLGIEEQFYLAWPLVLLLAARMRWSLLTVAAAIGAASFLLNLVLIPAHPVATFYLPFTRAFELLAGAALVRLPEGWGAASENARATTGLVLIAVATALLSGQSAYPGWWGVLPVAGTALLLSAPGSWFGRAVLAHPAMTSIGVISYPLYLWHWPLIVFLGIAKFGPPTLLERWLILGASFALAWATYRLVEIPIRFQSRSPRRALELGAGMATIGVLGAVIVWNAGFSSRLPEEIREMASVPTQSKHWRIRECLIEPENQKAFADDCVEPNRRPLVAVWGDSTAAALLPGLREEQKTHAFGIAQLTTSTCPPLLGIDVPGYANCREANDRTLEAVVNANPDIVLLHGTWDRFPGLTGAIGATVRALHERTSARVVVLGAAPAWQRGLPAEILRYYVLHHALLPERWSHGVTGGATLDVPMRAAAAEGGDFISAWDVFCNADGCLTRTGPTTRDITISDRVHLTESASRFLVRAIIDRILGPDTRAER